MKKPGFILLLFIGLFANAWSQAVDSTLSKSDSIWDSFEITADDEVLRQLDAARALYHRNTYANQTSSNGTMDSLLIAQQWSVDTLKSRMSELDASTPFDLTYNTYVEAFIKLYLIKKKDVTERILGLSPYYFPLFEEALDRHGLPLELKYLPVVESALNPKARSRAGAMGLWQFMYSTGKMYGLTVNSYYDERMDPYLSTEAACRYLKSLYKQYGDWNLVIAAYNCGPGNVNKAIRRSGGSRDFWVLRSYLPRETRGYVPAFHAVNYSITYAHQHGLTASTPEVILEPTDTVYVCQNLEFATLAKTLDIEQSWLEYYNPMYRVSEIPKSAKGLCLYLPTEKTGLFLQNEDSIYALEHKVKNAMVAEGAVVEKTVPPNEIIHQVRSGEVMGVIAQRYGITVTQLKDWNNLYSSRIYPGQRLKIYSSKPVSPAPVKTVSEPVKTATATASKEEVVGFNYYTIQPGDTLWDIANKYKEVSVADLKKWNSHLNFKKLKPGDKIKISKTT